MSSRHDAHFVCPWWLGPLLCCPLRRFFGSSEALLAPYVKPGMTVLEPGCGMGYFTLPLARTVGPSGKVVCADVQPQMINGLMRRARRANLSDRIEAFTCTHEDLGIGSWKGRIDVALAMYMVHEVADQRGLLQQIADAVRPGGTLVIVEPRGHVSSADFEKTIATAAAAGFTLRSRDRVRRNHRAVFDKK